MGSLKDDEKSILAGEGQTDEDLEEEDIHSSEMDIHDLSTREATY